MSPRLKQPLSLEHAILGFVRQQALHGYEIYQHLSAPDGLGMIWSLKQSQFYALVAKLEQEGYLDTTLEYHGFHPPRKLLHLTADGAAAFATWIKSPVRHLDDRWCEFLAKLYFAQRTDYGTAQELMTRQRSLSTAWLDKLNGQLQGLDAAQTYARQVLQLHIHQLETFLDWLDHTSTHHPTMAQVTYPIAAINDSPNSALAQHFVDYVCSPTAQAILAEHGFLVTDNTHLKAAPTLVRPTRDTGTTGVLHVFAAASLSRAFQAIGAAFSASHPGTSVRFTFAGSHDLADQLARGATADVFAPAHRKPMDAVIDAGRVNRGGVWAFASNQLAVITPKDNPAHLAHLGDLSRPGLRIALGSAATAVGHYTRDFLTHIEHTGCLGSAGQQAVLHNVVWYGASVTDVLAKVVQGEVDAGIVFHSDYYHAAGSVQAPIIPPGNRV